MPASMISQSSVFVDSGTRTQLYPDPLDICRVHGCNQTAIQVLNRVLVCIQKRIFWYSQVPWYFTKFSTRPPQHKGVGWTHTGREGRVDSH